MSKNETVDVTIKLPKSIIDFLKDMGEDPMEYIVYAIIEDIRSGLEADAWSGSRRWVKKHNLMPIFRQHEMQVDDSINPEKDC